MGDVGGGGGIGRRTHTGLVGEETALDAVHDAGTAEAAEDRLQIKGTGKDLAEHLGQHVGIENGNDQGHHDVDGTHHGDENARHRHDALTAAQQAVAHQCSDNETDDPGSRGGVIEAVGGESGLEVIGGQHIKAHAVSQHQEYGEHHGNALLPLKGRLDIVGGAAVAAVLAPLLVNLSQGTLHEGGSTADDGDDPHPEHAAKAADTQGGGHADDVARTHTGGGGYHQGLEGGDAVLIGLLRHGAELMTQQAELGKAGADGEIEAAQHQQDDQHIAVEGIVDAVDEICKHTKTPNKNLPRQCNTHFPVWKVLR